MSQVPESRPGDGDISVGGTEPTQRQTTVTPVTNLGPRAVAIRARTIWLAAAVAVGGLICWIVVREAFQVLLLLFMAIVVAEGLRPLVDWLQQRRLPRSIAVLALYLIIGAILGGLGWFLLRPLSDEVKAFLVNLPRYAAQTQRLVDQVQQTLGTDVKVSQLLDALPGQSGQILSFLLRGPLVLGHIIYGVIAILLLAFYWLTAVGGLKAFLVGLLPPPAQNTASETVTEMGWRVGGYLRGVAIDMVVIGVFSGVGCALLGVPLLHRAPRLYRPETSGAARTGHGGLVWPDCGGCYSHQAGCVVLPLPLPAPRLVALAHDAGPAARIADPALLPRSAGCLVCHRTVFGAASPTLGDPQPGRHGWAVQRHQQ